MEEKKREKINKETRSEKRRDKKKIKEGRETKSNGRKIIKRKAMITITIMKTETAKLCKNPQYIHQQRQETKDNKEERKENKINKH